MRIAMIAITTSSSIRVKPRRFHFCMTELRRKEGRDRYLVRKQPSGCQLDSLPAKHRPLRRMQGIHGDDHPGVRRIFDEELMNIVPGRRENTSPSAGNLSS